MTVSMRVMSAGDGYKYLLKTIAAADGDRSLSTPLTRYYAEAGTPPGRWIGAGVAALSNGELSVGDRVSEAQLQLLIGMGRDPITGNPLGLAFPTYKTTPERIESRVAALDPSLTPGAKGEAVAQIVAEETARGTRRAVAGLDFTFSIPKPASVLWAVADAGVQAMIGEAHHRAVAEVVAFMEREVAATRTDATAVVGAVAQVDVTGLIATAFDHFDSRVGKVLICGDFLPVLCWNNCMDETTGHTAESSQRTIDTNAEVAAFLVSDEAESIVSAAIESLGWALLDYSTDKPFLRPGAGVSVGYFVTARASDRDFSTYLTASTEKVVTSNAVLTFTDPSGVVVDPIHVWQFPHDPSLPGLPEATHAEHIGEQLGIPGLTAEIVVYRPTRRAVVEYKKDGESVAFGKVLHPKTGHELVRRTNAVAEGDAPIPAIIHSTDSGVVISETAKGHSFSNEIAFRPDDAKTKIAEFERILDSLGPAVAALDEHSSWAKRIHHYAKTAREILPAYAQDIDRITQMVTEIINSGYGGPDVATHGDFFEANILIDDAGELTLIDLDHVGPGKRNDDWGCLLAHVSVLPFLTEAAWVEADPSEPYRERLEYLNPGGMRCSFYPRSEEVLEAWCAYLEERTNPYDLYARTTAVALSMASNSDVNSAPREAEARMRRVLWWEERTRSWAPGAHKQPERAPRQS